MEAEVGSVDHSRPTATDLWLSELEDTVETIVKYFRRKTEPVLYDGEGYDSHFLYAHRDRLRTVEDVRAASDDVLLEALGLPNVAGWGWMWFMVRALWRVSMLAHNWGLPCARVSEDTRWPDANLDERRAQAALHFIDLMRERGYDAEERMIDCYATLVADVSVRLGCEADEVADACLEQIRKADDFAYHVLVCGVFTFRPEALRPPGPVLYDGEYRARYLSRIRAAAANRRRLWRESGELGRMGEMMTAAVNSG